jgi:hypothetical protein
VRFALLIYTDEAQDAQATKEDRDNTMVAYNAFGEQYKEQIEGGEALTPTTSATTVRLRDGKALTTDGPFAETKEQLGGFYIVRAANLDEAINIASHIPGAKVGSIEVRPVVEFGE